MSVIFAGRKPISPVQDICSRPSESGLGRMPGPSCWVALVEVVVEEDTPQVAFHSDKAVLELLPPARVV